MAVIKYKIPYWYEIASIYSQSNLTNDYAKVVFVNDGDTIRCKFRGSYITVRLAGIDAPELSQTYGLASSFVLSNLILHKHVNLIISGRGKYGRYIAIVLINGVNVNSKMVELGAAWVYNQFCSACYRRAWLRLQANAKSASIGLWKYSNPIPPWEYRNSFF